jgi:hypothetical protein
MKTWVQASMRKEILEKLFCCVWKLLSVPLVPGPSHLGVEIAIAKLKKYKSSGSDQIPAELIQAGGRNITVYNLHTH